MPLRVTANVIASAGGGFEPQRKNNFLVSIVGVSGLDMISLQPAISKFPFHKETTEVVKIPFMNEERKVAGRTTYDDYSLVVKDYVDPNIAGKLLVWRRLVFNPATGETGLAGGSRGYKKVAFLELFAPNGTVERKWKMTGVWPVSFDMGEGDMSAAEPVEITMALAIDFILEDEGVSGFNPAPLGTLV